MPIGSGLTLVGSVSDNVKHAMGHLQVFPGRKDELHG